MEKYHIIINDHKRKKQQYLGYLSNDALYTKNIYEMQRVGFDVNMHSLEEEPSKLEPYRPGYEWDENLYRTLISDYEQKTKKTLKLF